MVQVAGLSSRAVGVGVCAGVLAVGGLVSAGAAWGNLPTTPCSEPGHGVDRKGTPGDDVINVDVPAGETVVVCTAGGKDRVNINSVAASTNPATRLWLAFGQGYKTVNWAAGDIPFNSDVDGGAFNQGVIVRPDRSPDVTFEGADNSTDNSFFMCGTNAQFRVAVSGWALQTASKSYVYSSQGTDGWKNAGQNPC